MRAIVTYVATAIAFLALDAVWLTLTGQTLYKAVLGDLVLDQPRLGPAAAFYVIYIFGLVRFVVLPSVNTGGIGRALLEGALFGLVAYATYDLTNQATLKVWSMRITLMDLGWGAFVSAAGSAVGLLVARRFER